MQIDEPEAKVVQEIFLMYLNGMSILGIQRELQKRGIKSPNGKDLWCKRGIDTLLSNEKHSGDVIIFKTYSMGFHHTKRIVNDEPVSREKYHAIVSHPAIVSKVAFTAVQEEKARRSNVVKGLEGRSRKTSRYSSKKESSDQELEQLID